MVVTDSACAEQLFGFLQGRFARCRVVTRQRERAEGERAEERGACLAADLDGLFCVGKCLRPPSG